MADDWAQAFIILLKKGSPFEDLDKVSEFRPIALASTAGKIFLTVVADRLQRFMVRNSYIERVAQKGFLAGVPGCVEHTFVLYEALKEAKEHTRQIVVSWLDLANAYGSVRHNLIRFALDWYHVPKQVQALIFDYYEKLMAKIATKNWTTGFFLFDIGVFQGCVLSAILFLCVFQLLLDFLRPLEEKEGYEFKIVKGIRMLAKAYADDLALTTKSTAANQRACNKVDIFLSWTQTMKAKPKKCVSLGLRQFDKRIKKHGFEPVLPQTYSPFDPKLTISGQPMQFILDLTEPDDFKKEHFKFLGRWIHYYLDEHNVMNRIADSFDEDITKVDKSHVNGFMKLWLYQFYMLNRLSWPFTAHDLNLSFATDLRTRIQPFLKKWAGIGVTVDPGILYRTRDQFGLGLTQVDEHYKSMQITKCQILEKSEDSVVYRLFEEKTRREAKLQRVWRGSQLNTEINAQVDLNLRFPSQQGRQGLGAGNYNPNPTVKERRKMVAVHGKSLGKDKHVQHAHDLAMQGVWIQWHDRAIPLDLSWQNLIYGPGPHVLKFMLNASVNWVKTPDLLRLWNYVQSATCVLCGHKQCTLHHIIAACKHSLRSKRFTWRHDSILAHLQKVLGSVIQMANDAKDEVFRIPPLSATFTPAGGTSTRTTAPRKRSSLLDGVHDWKILVDFDKCPIVFPPEIYATNERPDIIIWSLKAKQVILIELTCPAEEGFEAAQVRKIARYTDLVTSINRDKRSGWSARQFAIEVGARGYVAFSVPRCLKRFGMASRTISKICNELSNISARCSFAIYLSRESLTWDQNRALLTPNDGPTSNEDHKH